MWQYCYRLCMHRIKRLMLFAVEKWEKSLSCARSYCFHLVFHLNYRVSRCVINLYLVTVIIEKEMKKNTTNDERQK